MAEAEPTTHSQRALLAGVMLVILLACVAAAWWLSQKGNVPVSILDEMRKTGLKKLWGDEPRTDFYLATDPSGRPAGWSAISRGPTEGGYGGTTYVREGMPAEGTWELSDSAQRGLYESMARTGRGRTRTRITLRDGSVMVEQGMGLSAEARPPSNYIPEGSLDMVLRLIENRGQGGRFAMIFDSDALLIQKGRKSVQFAIVSLAPQGDGVVKMEVGNMFTLYHLNQDGRVDKLEEFGAVKGQDAKLLLTRKLVTPDEIEAKFPGDELLGRLVEKAREEHHAPTSQPASEPG